MYKCRNCGKIFDEPKKVDQESFFGVYELFGNSYGIDKVNVCPYCETNDIDAAIECDNCGKIIAIEDSNKVDGNRICNECYEEEE